MTLPERVARCEEKLTDFERWQLDQNGTLHSLQKQMMSLQKQATGILVGVISTLLALVGNLLIRLN